MLAWGVVAALSSGAAMLLAAADGSLLASAATTSRSMSGDPERAHRALALGRILAHLLTGAALALMLGDAQWPRAAAVGTALLLMVASVALVEGIARDAGYTRAHRLAQPLAPVVALTDLLMLPVTRLGAAIERALGRVLPPADEETSQRLVGAEQFRDVVAAEAAVSPAEEDILLGVFSLRNTQVQEVMVPRVDVVGMEQGTPWSEMVDRIRSAGHARYPVFDDTLDNVVGMLYAKDLLRAVVTGVEPDDWVSLIRPAVFIPATKTIDQQLKDFKADRTHIAVVVDEYGGTAGIVTIEDVLEEIVGEIRDEYDVEEPPVVQEGKDRLWTAGRVSLSDLAELLDHDFQRNDLTTVGGLVYDAFGRVPRAGEATRVDGFRIVVERVRRRRIERVFIERLPALDEGGGG